jgi:hypothetical protein
MPPRFAYAIRQAQFLGDEPRLVVFARSVVNADHFLKRDNVGIYLAKYFDYPVGTHTAIEPSALVNVISCNPNPVHLNLSVLFVNPFQRRDYCCRSSTHPSNSCARSRTERCLHAS